MALNKKLEDMTLEELWELFPITLSDPQPHWKDRARDEAGILASLLSDLSPRITHIGSTAVGTIVAKPIIDILVEIPPAVNYSVVMDKMTRAGYICMSSSATRMSFNKGYTITGFAEDVFHIHIHRTGDCDEIYFRDYLIAHPDVAREYEFLKLSLLPHYHHDRDGYTAAKSEFVARITSAAKREYGDV